MAPKFKFLPQIALLTAAIVWGISFVVIKNSLDAVPPAYLLAIRFTIACAVLALLFHKKLKTIDLRTLACCGAAGFCLFLAYMTQTIGITDTTPGKNAFLTAVYCVIVPFLFWAVGGNRPTLWNISAAVLCLAGIGFVSLTNGFSISMGDSLTLVGGLFYAVHIVVLAKVCNSFDPGLCTVIQFGTAALCSWVTGALTESFPPLTAFTGSGLMEILYLSLFASAVAILFQTYGLKYASPNTGSILLSLEAVFGVAFSMLLYGEKLTPSLLLGFVLIFLAVITSETQWSFLRRKNTLADVKNQ